MQLYTQPIGQDKKKSLFKTNANNSGKKLKAVKVYKSQKKIQKKLIPYILNEEPENLEANNLIHRLD